MLCLYQEICIYYIYSILHGGTALHRYLPNCWVLSSVALYLLVAEAEAEAGLCGGGRGVDLGAVQVDSDHEGGDVGEHRDWGGAAGRQSQLHTTKPSID